MILRRAQQSSSRPGSAGPRSRLLFCRRESTIGAALGMVARRAVRIADREQLRPDLALGSALAAGPPLARNRGQAPVQLIHDR